MLRFAQPKEFLDLCARLREVPVKTEFARTVAHRFRGRSYNQGAIAGKTFEYLVGHTAANLVTKTGAARPLELRDKDMLRPYNLKLQDYSCTLTLNGLSVAEFDAVLRFGESGLWIFEIKLNWQGIGNPVHLSVLETLNSYGISVSCASVTTQDNLGKFKFSENKKIAEHLGVVLTYLPINRGDVFELAKKYGP